MKSKFENKERMRLFLTITITTLCVYLGFKYILPLILPFIFAYFLAWIIRPVTEFLYRRMRIPRILGSSVSLTLLLAILGTGIFYLCKTLMKQSVLFIKNVPVYLNILADKLDSICMNCDEMFGFNMGTMRTVVDDNITQMVNRIRTKIMPGITERTISFTILIIAAIGVFLIVFVAAVLIAKDLPAFRKKYEHSELYRDIHKITEKLAYAGVAYLRSQLIIMVIVAFLCVLGLTILRNEYALLIGIGIAFMDALPILGSGIVFIPWVIIMLINGNIYYAAILITTYLICQIIREVLEPKLIGNRIGVKPLFTLISMYIGVRLFAISGFILGPIGLIIIITVVKVVNDKKADNSSVTYDEE